MLRFDDVGRSRVTWSCDLSACHYRSVRRNVKDDYIDNSIKAFYFDVAEVHGSKSRVLDFVAKHKCIIFSLVVT